MVRERAQRIEELFHAAAGQPARARAAFVVEACGDDSELGREVMAMLAADDSRDLLLDTPVCDAVLNTAATRPLLDGQRVGAYEIVRLVGTGGMGNVYEAIQDRPRRSVALKLLRTALATHSEQRRFEYESALLGRLTHPNIASIYEAGIHTDGPVPVPYFAMEYVADSRNLVEFASARNLSARRRLEVFVEVCGAVQYGHQKGIVHCDLKPGNVLVDPSGVPKVIDYGVARAVDTDLTLTALRTSAHALLGTLQYMSPEQLAGEHAKVDTRSDVYALGLVLFELLAEARPYDFSASTLSGAIRAIETTPSPSLGSVRSELRGDLSTIVAKAMEKERDRRYQSPSEMAADVRRFLNSEPIQARPPTLSYRLRKYAARNKPVVASLVLVVVTVLFGLGVAAWQFRNATVERDRARTEARKAQRISEFLQGVLAFADPRSSTAAATIREALDQAAGAIESQSDDDLHDFADVQIMIGGIYERLGNHARAERHLQAALESRRAQFGDQSCAVASALSDLSWSVGARDPSEQERLLREAMDIYVAEYGDAHAVTAVHKSYLAGCLVGRGDYVEAEPLVREALATLRETRETEDDDAAFAAKVLAQCLYGQGRIVEAEAAFRHALSLHRKVYPPDHYELGLMVGSFGNFLTETDRPDEAAVLTEEASEISRMRVGEKNSCADAPQ